MRYLLLAGLLVTVTVFVLARGDGRKLQNEPDSFQPRRGGIYIAPLSDDPPTLDPALAEDTTSVSCVLQIVDTLVRIGEGNKLVPSVAERWEISPDQRTYTFIIRRGVRFHSHYGDGSPTFNRGREVTAADFVFSFERVLSPALASPRAMMFMVVEGARDFVEGRSRHVRGFEAVSDHLLRIRLCKPFAPFLATLTMTNAGVVPREDVLAGSLSKKPVGSGPFIFKSYTQGASVELVRNPGYFAGPPYLDGLRFCIDTDEKQQFARFLKGEIFHTTVPDPEYEETRKSPRWRPYFTEVSQLGTYYLGMNVNSPPFDSLAVRRAIQQSIDKEAIVRYIRAGRVLRAKGPLPPGIPGYNAALMVPSFNIENAERELKKAGYPRSGPNGPRKGFPTLHLFIPRGEADMRVARAVQANLADMGINCVPVANDWKKHLELVNAGKAPFFRLGWVADYLDADNFLYYEFHSSNIGVSNACGYKSGKVDDLLDAARQTTNEARRKELYKEAEQLIVNDCVWICLYYYNAALVRQPFVHGLNLTPLGDHMIRYDRVWIGRRTHAGREGTSTE